MANIEEITGREQTSKREKRAAYMKECIDIKKGVGGCLLCTTSSSIWTFARPRFSCIIPYTLITGKCINVQARIKNCTGFNEREEKIKVESWLGKTIFPSLLHYAQIEMRFLFNEIMHEARGKKWSKKNRWLFFQSVDLSKSSMKLVWVDFLVFVRVVVAVLCLTAATSTNQQEFSDFQIR